MITTSHTDRRIRRRLRAFSILPVMLLSLTLPACADKAAALDPSHRAELTQALESVERKKSQRLLVETRLSNAHGLAVLGACGALVLGLAIGSARLKSEGD